MIDKNKKQIEEQAVLVGVISQEETKEQVEEYLSELEFLLETAGGTTNKKFYQSLTFPNPKTYVGKGKLEEIKDYIDTKEIKLVIFDDELSPTQLRNIERILEVRILDRTSLILDIFAQRARTAHAKTQVELAQYQYILPRLTRMWTHLERQRGGIGMRGPGESQIETDRRIILEKISKLKEDLKNIDKQMYQQRKSRGKLIRVALVGYTNVGKSTIMNLISKSDILAENKLFATLDTTVRKVVINNLPFLLSDTVGFIRKLPHKLIESFKSTLDETRESDIIIHVVDISHPSYKDQIEIVEETLKEININNKPTILVFNKIDAFSIPEEFDIDYEKYEKGSIMSLEDLKKTYMAKSESQAIFISAKNNENIAELKDLIFELVEKIQSEKYPFKTNFFE